MEISPKIKMEAACVNGDIETVKYLLEKDLMDIESITPLSITGASYYGRLDIIKYLFEKGVPIGERAIYHSISVSNFGNINIIKYLFEKGVPITEGIMYYAFDFGSLAVVKYLLSIGESRAPRPRIYSEKISNVINNTRKYRKELLSILEYKLGHPSYMVLDYLEYSL